MGAGRLILLVIAVAGFCFGLPFLWYMNQESVQASLIATMTVTIDAASSLPFTPVIQMTVMP